jgi:protein-S-isoprenylcysteine O-methyltransferase Ste14
MTSGLYRNRWLIAYGNFIFHYRNVVFPVALAVLVVAFLPDRPADGARTYAVDLFALVLAVLGEGLRVLTVGLEYIKRGGLNKRIYASKLVTHGMFAHCRNPLYVGNVLLSLALLSVPHGLTIFLVGGAISLVTYIAIVAAEEQFLAATFGAEYDAYCARVNRWVPDLRGMAETMQSMRFNWRRVLLKEVNSIYGWVVLACLLKAASERFTGLFGDPDFQVYFAVAVVATIVFAVVRGLKRSRLLRVDA